MVRSHLITKGAGLERGFRMRGENVSRLESFSDAVFGFALTLLVVSLEVPHTFRELMRSMQGFGAFAVCFFFLAQVWYHHYVFFRRYGLEDTTTVFLNLTLLFVVLFYIYPVKFLFFLLVSQLMGVNLIWPGHDAEIIQGGEAWQLMVIYGAGFAAVFCIFALLYAHAYRMRHALDLNPLEIFDTKARIGSNFVVMGVGLLSIVLAVLTRNGGLAGMAYLSLWVFFTVEGAIQGRRRRTLEAQLDEARTLTSADETAIPAQASDHRL